MRKTRPLPYIIKPANTAPLAPSGGEMKRFFILSLLAALLLFSLACTLPTITIISREAYNATQVQKTLQSLQQPPAPAAEQPAAPAPAPILAPTATLYWPTAAPTSIPYVPPCYQAAFVSETVPDGTSFNPGQTFTKTWRLRNTGICTWQPDFRFVFYSGTSMGSPAYILLGKTVKPGQEVTLSLNLTAPTTKGTYTGYWRLRAGSGELFAQVYALIKVSSTSPAPTATSAVPFAVTSVTSDGNSHSPGVCSSYNYNFNLTITASNAGTVTYRIVDSLSGAGSLRSVTFTGAGAKTIAQSITLSGTGAHAISAYIDDPNHQTFGPFFTITCDLVSNVSLSAVQNNPSITCGETDSITTTAQVTAVGAGTVTFYWEFYSMTESDQLTPETLVFTSAGTQTVTHTWNNVTVEMDVQDFNYHFVKTLPLPENSYNSVLELTCEEPLP